MPAAPVVAEDGEKAEDAAGAEHAEPQRGHVAAVVGPLRLGVRLLCLYGHEVIGQQVIDPAGQRCDRHEAALGASLEQGTRSSQADAIAQHVVRILLRGRGMAQEGEPEQS